MIALSKNAVSLNRPRITQIIIYPDGIIAELKHRPIGKGDAYGVSVDMRLAHTVYHGIPQTFRRVVSINNPACFLERTPAPHMEAATAAVDSVVKDFSPFHNEKPKGRDINRAAAGIGVLGIVELKTSA